MKPASENESAVAERTRQRILESALRVFVERGFQGATVREIAAAAGVTHGLIRHYFKTKETVWRAAVDLAVDEFSASLGPLLRVSSPPGDDVADQARSSMTIFLHTAADHPELIRLIIVEGTEGGKRFDYIRERLQDMGDVASPVFDELQARGYVRQFDNDSFFMFYLLAGAAPFALRGLSDWLVAGDLGNADVTETHIQRVLQTLLPER